MQSKYKEVVVIGVGGTGGYLINPLLTYLRTESSMPKKLTLVDGDIVERKNLDRQFFSEQDLEKNKAEAWADRLGTVEDMNIFFNPQYLTKENAGMIISDGAIVFSCVDNHFTRRLIYDVTERCKNILVICGGNEFTDGNVQIFEKVNGRDTLPSLIKYHEEIEFPQDKSPADMSCEELTAAEPQLIFVNLESASQMLGAFYRRTQFDANHCEVHFDVKTGNALPSERP